MAELSLAAAFLAGIASFASPCVLPLIPAYLSFLAGSSKGGGGAKGVFANAAFFTAGLAVALTLSGFAIGAALPGISGDALLLAARLSGLLMVLLALAILGVIPVEKLMIAMPKANLPQGGGYAASFALGAVFAFAFCPVMGAFLLFVLALTLSAPAQAPAMLLSYSLGLGLPFLAAGAFASRAQGFIRANGGALAIFNRAMGMMALVIGILTAAGAGIAQ